MALQESHEARHRLSSKPALGGPLFRSSDSSALLAAPRRYCIERCFFVIVMSFALRVNNMARDSVAKGLFLMRDGQVLVEYGKLRVRISPAQYRANGYRPPCG